MRGWKKAFVSQAQQTSLDPLTRATQSDTQRKVLTDGVCATEHRKQIAWRSAHRTFDATRRSGFLSRLTRLLRSWLNHSGNMNHSATFRRRNQIVAIRLGRLLQAIFVQLHGSSIWPIGRCDSFSECLAMRWQMFVIAIAPVRLTPSELVFVD